MNKLKGKIQSPQSISGKLQTDSQINVNIVKTGATGASAYEIWLEHGNDGSIEDFLNSMGANTYIHEQIHSSSRWEIPHQMSKYPSVTIVDTGGSVVIGDIQYIDKNNIEINFNFEFSGIAYLN